MEFACPAAFGDLTAALLALAALAAVVKESSAARPLLWVFNVEGTLDPGHAIYLPTSTLPSPHGTRLLDPRLLVPALLVTHYIVFVILLRPWRAR
jgi:hypothetical protein